MATTNTVNKDLNIVGIGDTGWGSPTNDNVTILDKALGSFTTVSGTSGNITLTDTQYQNMCLKSDTAAFLADVTFIIPSGVAGQWVVINQSAFSNFSLIVKNDASSSSISIPRGKTTTVYSDGTSVFFTDSQSINIVTLTSGTAATYTPTPGARFGRATCAGGGGGGGGTDGQGSGTGGAAGGGGAGGVAYRYFSLVGSYTYTIGAGGAGGPAGNNDGSTGGTTTFSGTGVSLSASGGIGGSGRTGSSSDGAAAAGGAGGGATGGDLNVTGSSGTDGYSSIQLNSVGNGGPSAYGSFGAGYTINGSSGNGSGGDASGYNAGGGGASVVGSSANSAGGDGAPGVIIVEEFA